MWIEWIGRTNATGLKRSQNRRNDETPIQPALLVALRHSTGEDDRGRRYGDAPYIERILSERSHCARSRSHVLNTVQNKRSDKMRRPQRLPG